MEKYKGTDYPEALDTLPKYDANVYSGSVSEFFLCHNDLTVSSACVEGYDNDSVSDPDDDDDDFGESLDGLFRAAEHIFYSLKATIEYHNGSSPSEVLELLTHVVHVNDMTPSDQAAVLYFKAVVTRNCGMKGMDVALDLLRQATLTDPDGLRWPLYLIIFSGEKRRSNRGQRVDASEIISIVQVIDSVLQHDLKPWMRVKYQFDKLQALNEISKANRDLMSNEEQRKLHQTSRELVEELVRTSKRAKMLSYCAQLISNNKSEVQRAVEIIERALEMAPHDTYTLAKASNVYKRAGKLEKALECAEQAADYYWGYGSVWQVFLLKVDMNHDFDYEAFFSDTIKKYPQDENVKSTHKNAALFHVAQGDFKHALEHFNALLVKYDSGDYIFGDIYWDVGKRVHTAEACYNVALYVMSSEFEHDEEMKCLCQKIIENIQEVFDVSDFKYAGRISPKNYVEWLRKKNSGLFPDSKSWISNNHSDGFARYEKPVNRESSYPSCAGSSAFKDRQTSYVIPNDRIDRNSGHEQSTDRVSTYRNNFGKLEGAVGNTPLHFSKPRTTQPQSYGNQLNRTFKPSSSENWRLREKTAEETPGTCSSTGTRSYPRRPADTDRNWRERE
ncbi:hypothetical protein GE061_008963 [Apolygus lucorum]|uniref:Tetratricopeptide repeat protein n=1 Tax=Apolygus lucorum TaxID=248454 RepID=A0A8S9Y053_APOLU|nr:hypothetical protein GE061_008963 [Apolygus lucorum]